MPLAALEKLKLSDEQQFGVTLFARSRRAVRQIAQNAGYEGSIVVDKVRNNTNPNFGFNALTEKYEDLVAAGVIDPTKVSRCALQNAASIASLMLTTEAMITEKPKEDEPAGAVTVMAEACRHGRYGWHGRYDVILPLISVGPLVGVAHRSFLRECSSGYALTGQFRRSRIIRPVSP